MLSCSSVSKTNIVFGFWQLLRELFDLLQTDREGDKKSQKILNELENIDDECEEKSIDFVKTSDEGIDKEYDLPTLPALAFYRNKFRTIYQGLRLQIFT